LHCAWAAGAKVHASSAVSIASSFILQILTAIAQISQGPNGEVRVRLHDKHAALVSIGKHLGMFTDVVQMKAVYGVSEKPMSAEEWKKQFVREG
jgi:hypothetical protein